MFHSFRRWLEPTGGLSVITPLSSISNATMQDVNKEVCEGATPMYFTSGMQAKIEYL